ncbi:hypothetical protein [Pararhodobacter marinus]|uniref:hypothetical protein n=1 Tax=Pararhodobacter marinus TaxID=2184063 RepID=UPI003513A903
MLNHRVKPALLAALLASLPVASGAQDAEGDTSNRLRGLFDDMIGAVDPWLSDLSEMLGDLSGWHAPERLPNGDILIRRRDDQEPDAVPGDESEEDGSEDGADPGETLEL